MSWMLRRRRPLLPLRLLLLLLRLLLLLLRLLLLHNRLGLSTVLLCILCSCTLIWPQRFTCVHLPPHRIG